MANGHVELRGRKWYAFWVDENGKRRSKSVGEDEGAARRYLAARQADAAVAKGSLREVGFDALAHDFVLRVAPTRYKRSTVDNIRCDVRAHLVPYFGDAPVSSIATRDVDDYVSMRVTEHGAAAGTVRGELNTLRQVLATGVSWGYAPTNAAMGTRLKVPKRSEASFLRPTELKSLFEAAAPEWRPLLMTAGLAGLRCGELGGLLERDIDFDRHQIHVKRSVYNGRYNTTKTGSSVRNVDMPPTLERELRSWLASPLRLPTPTGIVFPSPKGNPMSSHLANANGLRPALAAASLPRVRMHDLRHTYASLLLANRESIKYVQRMMGHDSIKTTIDTYGHLIDEQNRPAAERLDEAVWGTSLR